MILRNMAKILSNELTYKKIDKDEQRPIKNNQ